jgi:monofunctional biosynthetic peptidoglycan transglycosylase
MKLILKAIFRITFKLVAFLMAISLFFVFLYKYINPPITPLMIIRHFESSQGEETIKIYWKALKEISPNAILAVIAAEDQKFFDHGGFDFEAIKKAFKKNRKNRKIKGASTISQQVAKNVFLWPSRTWIRKGFEAYFTLLIESIWSKRRILEVYINVVETGKNIYGFEAASKIYFHKSSSNLSVSEAALIAAILPNPKKRNIIKPSSLIISRKNWIIHQMNNLGGKSLLEKNSLT